MHIFLCLFVEDNRYRLSEIKLITSVNSIAGLHSQNTESVYVDFEPGSVLSYKLRYIVGLGLVEMVISTNPKPTIYIVICTRIRAQLS